MQLRRTRGLREVPMSDRHVPVDLNSFSNIALVFCSVRTAEQRELSQVCQGALPHRRADPTRRG